MRLYVVVAALSGAAAGWSGAACAQPPTILRPAQTAEAQTKQQPARPPVITAVDIVRGGRLVATAGDDHVVRLFSTETGRIVQTLSEHGDWVRAIAFSPDGRVLASAGDDRRILLWDVATGKPLAALPEHPHAIYSLAFSADGGRLAAAGFERQVRLYDAERHELIQQFEGPGEDLRSVAFSPDATRLAVGGRSGRIRVWSLGGDGPPLEIDAGLGRLRTLAFLPDGRKLVSAGEGRKICVWDANSGARLQTLECASGKVLSMVVCGEDRIATGGSDNLVRIWNWHTQAEDDRLLGHTGSVASLAFDPQSGMIISGSFDTTVRVWKLDKPTRNDTAGEPFPDTQVR